MYLDRDARVSSEQARRHPVSTMTASRTSAYSTPPSSSSTEHPASGTQRVRPANPAILRLRPVSIAADGHVSRPPEHARTSGREVFNALVLFASLCVGTVAVAAAVIAAFFR